MGDPTTAPACPAACIAHSTAPLEHDLGRPMLKLELAMQRVMLNESLVMAMVKRIHSAMKWQILAGGTTT